MEFRLLGGSGLKLPVLSFGTGTFGGGNDFFRKWGTSDVAEAKRLVDVCLEAGVNMFDTADVYSRGLSEEILGQAIKGRRDQLLISTKATFRMSDEPNDIGSSRHHLTKSLEASLRRLQTDYVDIYTIHGFDPQTPIEETLSTLNSFVQSGKVRYIVCSNYSGWHLMKALSISERYGWERYVGHQAYYSLIGREFEWELMPLGLDQNIGTLVWSPLAGGFLSGKYRRSQPMPEETTRVGQGGGDFAYPPREWFYNLIDVLDEVAKETGKSVVQISLNWLLQRPTVTTIVFGARNEEQLRQNLGAVGWSLNAEQMEKIDRASQMELRYPYWHQQAANKERNPFPVPYYS